VDEFFAESDGDGAAEAKPAEARSDERSAAPRNTDLAADDLVKKAAPVAAAPAAGNMQDEDGLAAGKNRTRKEALAESTESQSTTRKGAAMPGSPTPGSGDLAASTRAAEGGGGGGGTDPRSREDLADSLGNRRDTTAPVVVLVRGPEGRAEFSALLAARNIGFTRRPAEKMRELLAEKAATKPGALSASAEGERREAGKADDLERNGLPEAPQTGFADRAAVESMSGTEEVIAISGSPAAIGELLAFLEAGRGNGLDLKVKGRAEALKRLARVEAKQDVAVDKPAADRARGAGGPAAETLDRNAVDGEERARPPAKVDTAAEAPVTVLVRLVDIAPGNPAAGPTAAAVPAEPAAPAAGEAQGAGERQTP
jgi:hypothetical protein